MTSSAMPCRAALAASAGTIKSMVELLSTASRKGVSGSSDLPSARAVSMALASLVNWFKSRACKAKACSSRPRGPAVFPKAFSLPGKSWGARGNHCNSA